MDTTEKEQLDEFAVKKEKYDIIVTDLLADSSKREAFMDDLNSKSNEEIEEFFNFFIDGIDDENEESLPAVQELLTGFFKHPTYGEKFYAICNG
jgi:hypothetical protein